MIMTDVTTIILNYLFEASLILSLLTLLYWTVFRKLTFYAVNRAVICFILVSAFLLPVINVQLSVYQPPVLSEIEKSLLISQPENPGLVKKPLANQVVEIPTAEFKVDKNTFRVLTPMDYLLIIYLIGALFLVGKTIRRLLMMRKLLTGGRWISLRGQQVIVCETDHPFSFFSYIFLGQQHLERNDIDLVLHHEAIHCKNVHSMDVIIFEFSKALFWFNPFIYILSRHSKLVNEFFTDEKVAMTEGLERYTSALINISGIAENRNHGLSIASNFAVISLDLRFVQLVRKPSSGKSRWRYLSLLPLLSVMFGLFSCNLTDNVTKDGSIKTVKAYFSDEFGDQVNRQGKVLVDLEYDQHGNLITDTKAIRYKNAAAHNRTSALLSFINWGKEVNVLHFGNDWVEVSRLRDFQNAEVILKEFRREFPKEEFRLEERTARGAIFYKIVRLSDGKVVSTPYGKNMKFEIDESGNILSSQSVHSLDPFLQKYGEEKLEDIKDPEIRNNLLKFFKGNREYIETLDGVFEYDVNGRLVKYIRQWYDLIEKRSFEYDEDQRLTKVTRLDAEGKQINSFTIKYDENGNIDKVTAFNTDNQPEYTAIYEYTFH